jgi:ankyrin repeat protein
MFFKFGYTPLHVVCKEGHREIAVALLDKGADIHMKNNVSISNTCYLDSLCIYIMRLLYVI